MYYVYAVNQLPIERETPLRLAGAIRVANNHGAEMVVIKDGRHPDAKVIYRGEGRRCNAFNLSNVQEG